MHSAARRPHLQAPATSESPAAGDRQWTSSNKRKKLPFGIIHPKDTWCRLRTPPWHPLPPAAIESPLCGAWAMHAHGRPFAECGAGRPGMCTAA